MAPDLLQDVVGLTVIQRAVPSSRVSHKYAMLLRSITVAALTTVVAAQSTQIHPRTVDDLLPASTYAAMRFGGLDACREATGQLSLVQLVKTFVGEVPAHMREEFLDGRLDMAASTWRPTTCAMCSSNRDSILRTCAR